MDLVLSDPVSGFAELELGGGIGALRLGELESTSRGILRNCVSLYSRLESCACACRVCSSCV